ncbi:MAG: YIP1 family protein [Acidobacteriota bacterium]|nr:YIP1 family protein [Acidobacteriota bacterium]
MSEPVIERPPAPSLISRAIGIITAPRATFEKIVAAPRVGGALALVALIGAIAIGGFLSTEVGQQAWIDQSVEQQEAFSGQPVNDAGYQQLVTMAPYAGYMGAAQMIISVPIMALLMGGILYAIFNALMGGTATFKQVMSVVAHSQIISALAFLVSMPINFAKGSMSGATNLGVLFPMLDESSFAARLLGMVDLFAMWWLVVLSIGLAVLYRRKTGSVAMVLFGIYAVIALGFAAYLSSRGGA